MVEDRATRKKRAICEEVLDKDEDFCSSSLIYISTRGIEFPPSPRSGGVFHTLPCLLVQCPERVEMETTNLCSKRGRFWNTTSWFAFQIRIPVWLKFTGGGQNHNPIPKSQLELD